MRRTGMRTAFAVVRLTSALGAEITGLDLREVTQGEASAIRDALHEHGVLVFRRQRMTRDEQLEFTAKLGDLHGHPVREFLAGGPADPVSLVENDGHKPPQDDSHFHVDYSFSTEIPDLAVLNAEVVPVNGVDTIWSSAAAAYDSLSPRMRTF